MYANDWNIVAENERETNQSIGVKRNVKRRDWWREILVTYPRVFRPFRIAGRTDGRIVLRPT